MLIFLHLKFKATELLKGDDEMKEVAKEILGGSAIGLVFGLMLIVSMFL